VQLRTSRQCVEGSCLHNSWDYGKPTITKHFYSLFNFSESILSILNQSQVFTFFSQKFSVIKLFSVFLSHSKQFSKVLSQTKLLYTWSFSIIFTHFYAISTILRVVTQNVIFALFTDTALLIILRTSSLIIFTAVLWLCITYINTIKEKTYVYFSPSTIQNISHVV